MTRLPANRQVVRYRKSGEKYTGQTAQVIELKEEDTATAGYLVFIRFNDSTEVWTDCRNLQPVYE